MADKPVIVWSDKAEADLSRIYDFILLKWSLKEAQRFLILVEDFEDTVSKYPQTFKKSTSYTDVRLGFVHRNTTAVHAVRKDYIIILTLFDNRENEQFRS